jgi:hypothetical protein
MGSLVCGALGRLGRFMSRSPRLVSGPQTATKPICRVLVGDQVEITVVLMKEEVPKLIQHAIAAEHIATGRVKGWDSSIIQGIFFSLSLWRQGKLRSRMVQCSPGDVSG